MTSRAGLGPSETAPPRGRHWIGLALVTLAALAAGCGDRAPAAKWPRPEPPSVAQPLEPAPGDPGSERSSAKPAPSPRRASSSRVW